MRAAALAHARATRDRSVFEVEECSACCTTHTSKHTNPAAATRDGGFGVPVLLVRPAPRNS